MDPIYVTGHRNPDTDSIVAAIAYASLRNALGDREYTAACLGRVSDETQLVLNHFGFEPPTLISNVYTQVQDLDFDKPPILSAAVTVDRAWNELQKRKELRAIPVANDDGTLSGLISREDIASYNMELNNSCVLDKVPLFNVLSVLEGKVINEAGEYLDAVSGEVVLAIPESRRTAVFPSCDCVVICGDQPDMIRQALEQNVNCMILCRTELAPELKKIETSTCIIYTPCDAYKATRLIFQSTPIGRICTTRDLVCFHLADQVDHVKEMVLKYRKPCYPILDENNKIVGILTRYHLMRPRRKRVVLVDHNEATQSVPGLEEADILEIIDHHRLADIQTTNPIFVRNEPVGSTNTIIASMFQDKGLIPSEKLAGMMAAAILSDTVMFKSPTCTVRDIRTAERMARIANVSLEELGRKIFSESVEGKTAEELLYIDYKEFHIAGHDLAVSQVTCLDSASMLSRKEELLKQMMAISYKSDVSLVILMLTDVLLEGSYLLFVGDDDIISQAFDVSPKDNEVFLPEVMSRKKQVIPSLSALWG
ncbi:MAG: putative manganese-dependent inorganic diphosphatase [Clostridia bacterium]|nr:putative manganese-dependent inorganic diphosphatase [Clostridia bacterium]